MKAYSARDVASILGLPPARLRSLATAILEPERGPRGEFRFSFQDLVILRTARALLDGGVPVRRLRRAIDKLKSELPKGQALTELRISAVGEKVVVRDDHSVWNPEDGQVMFDFSVGELKAGLSTLVRPSPMPGQPSADEWFDQAWDLEVSSPSEAEAAYRRAIEADPQHVDAHVNLGRLLHERGELSTAEDHYRRAVAVDPSHALAWFNLGVLLEDQERLEEAAAAYQSCIAHDPESADAHYNLGGVYERIGRPREAIRHLTSFRRLTGGET